MTHQKINIAIVGGGVGGEWLGAMFGLQRPAALAGVVLGVALATWGGIPVSTTHTITGAIVGVGTAQDVKAVRWAVTFNLVIAWVLTIPASGLIAACFWYIGHGFL